MKKYLIKLMPITAGLFLQFLLLAVVVMSDPQAFTAQSSIAHNTIVEAMNHFSLSNITLSLLK